MIFKSWFICLICLITFAYSVFLFVQIFLTFLRSDFEPVKLWNIYFDWLFNFKIRFITFVQDFFRFGRFFAIWIIHFDSFRNVTRTKIATSSLSRENNKCQSRRWSNWNWNDDLLRDIWYYSLFLTRSELQYSSWTKISWNYQLELLFISWSIYKHFGFNFSLDNKCYLFGLQM